MKPRCRAFTLIELMVVVAIVATLSGLVFPAFRHARRSAQITASVQQLHQIHIACKLYQQEYDGDGKYGKASEMGLPPNQAMADRQKETTVLPGIIYAMLDSPCGLNPTAFGGDTSFRYTYLYWPLDDDPFFYEQSPIWRENTPLVTDENCNDHDVPLLNRHVNKRGVGVLLSGQLVNRVKAGRLDDWGWWAEPEL